MLGWTGGWDSKPMDMGGEKGGMEEEREEGMRGPPEWVFILVVGVLFVGWAGTVCGVGGVLVMWAMGGE